MTHIRGTLILAGALLIAGMVGIVTRTGVSQVPPDPAEAGGLPEVVFDNVAFTQLGAGPGGERRVRVDFRINVPLTAGSESYIFTAPPGANFEAGGVAGFPGFAVQVIRVFGTGDETPVESDAQMYIRKASGGLGAGAHAVSIVVNFPACNSWPVNFAAELYESGPGSTLIGMGSTTQFVPAACDECAGAVLSVAPLGADPPEVLVDRPSTLTSAVSLAGAPAEGTTFNLVLTTPPAEFSGGTVTASGFVERDDSNPTNPRATAYVSVTWPTAGTKVVGIGVQAVFGTCTKFLLAEPTAVFVVDKPKVVLDVFDSDRKLVARPAAGNRHAWVVVNDDDDDYDGTQDKDNVKKPVAGEDDLIRLSLKAVNPPVPNAVYTLEFNANRIGVLRAGAQGSLDDIQPGATTLDANKTVDLFIEGRRRSDRFRDAKIDVLVAMGGQPVPTGEAVDITVYQLDGARSVPGLCSYFYRGLKPMVLPPVARPDEVRGQWTVTPAHGMVVGAAEGYLGNPFDTHFDEATIQSSVGPVVGTPKYTIAPGFHATIKVNVVHVRPVESSPGAAGRVTLNRVRPQQEPLLPNLLQMVVKGKAASWDLDVVVDGPVVNGRMRGVTALEMGFVQHRQVVAEHGDYRAGFGFDGKRQESTIVGPLFLDATFPPTVRQTVAPWANSGNFSLGEGIVGYAAPQEAPAKTLRVSFGGFMDPYAKPVRAGADVRAGTFQAFGSRHDFFVTFAVRTTAPSVSADKRYFALASASWSFDVSGPVNKAGEWTAGLSAGLHTPGGTTPGESAPFFVAPDGLLIPPDLLNAPEYFDARLKSGWRVVDAP